MNSANAATSSPARSARAAVLLVEDEQPLLDVYVAALSAEFDVGTARTAPEAEERLKERTFQVVLADHLMPGESGLSLLTRWRTERPEIQRVLVTGYLKPDMLLRSATEAAVFRCLVKPVSIAELISVVREAVRAHDEQVARKHS